MVSPTDTPSSPTPAPSQPPDPESIKSLPLIHAELDRQQELFLSRASAFDARSGLLLATSGILIGFQASHPTVIGAGAAVSATLSGVCTAMAMLPARGGEISIRGMREKYVHRPPEETLLYLVDSRLTILEEDEARLLVKFHWIRGAIALLGVAAALLVGGIVYDTSSGQADRGGPPAPQPTTTAGTNNTSTNGTGTEPPRTTWAASTSTKGPTS
jgi:hypothetical protein